MKSWLKTQLSKNENHGIGPITSWEIDKEAIEIVTDFICLASKITSDGECRYTIKRCLFLGKKAMINIDNILKSRDIT